MICNVSKSTLSGIIACPPNKSYTHRAIFLASLAGNSTVKDALLSDDTLATMQACRALGAEMRVSGSAVEVKTPINLDSEPAPIDAKNSGTTIRIAAALAALCPGEAKLTGDSSLQKRPMQPLLDALDGMGARCSSQGGTPPLAVRGVARGGDVSIQGGVSSQFISALLLCAPLTERGIALNIQGGLVSRPYVDLTLAAMRAFGADVAEEKPYERYAVKPRPYKPSKFAVPADSSSMALLLSGAVLAGGTVGVRGNFTDTLQADAKFLDMLTDLGVSVSINKGTITPSTGGNLTGGSFDLRDTPDLLPPLAVLSLRCTKPLEITNVAHARLKETDRVAILSRELAKLGLDVRERNDGMLISPPSQLRGADLDSGGDHRLFMAFCMAGMHVGGCTVSDPGSVGVSYPGFVAEMARLGAKISC